MGDSVRPDSIPLTVSIAATYANGRYAVTDAAVAARFPRARYGWCRIDVTGTLADAADVLDVEAGDATPATANLWVQSWHVLRRPGLPVLYVNRANMPQVIKACQSGGSEPGRDYGLWMPHGDWDESIVYDDSLWLPQPPRPAAPDRAQAQAALAVLAAYVEAQ
jgi:hypothetical protein